MESLQKEFPNTTNNTRLALPELQIIKCMDVSSQGELRPEAPILLVCGR